MFDIFFRRTFKDQDILTYTKSDDVWSIYTERYYTL